MRNTALWLAASMSGGLVTAAPVAEMPDSVTLEEVSVTAIKNGLGIGSRPVAATIVGAADIRRENIVTVKGAAPQVPNLYIPDYGSRMTSSIYMRGIGARIDQPAVGLNVDNVSFLNKDNYDFDIPDIAKIEVIRGPQSLLYGRNAMAGVVNVHTLSPLQWEGVRASATFAAPFMTRLSAGVYGRLSPSWGMSLSAYFTHSDGEWRNGYNNSRIGTENAGTLRWKTVWRPSATVLHENTASLQINSQNGYPYEYVGTGKIAYNDTCYYHRVSFSDGLTVKWAPSTTFSLSSITGVQYLSDDMTLDNDFLPDSYFTLQQKRHEWAVTQDFLAKGKAAGGRYEWLAGLYGFYRSASVDAPVTFQEDGIGRLILGKRNEINPHYPLVWDSSSFPLESHFDSRQRGIALYHKSTLNLGCWSVAAGVRWEMEHPSLHYRSVCHTSYTTLDATGPGTPTVYSHTPVDIDDAGHLSHTYNELLPSVELSWHPGGGLSSIYASIAKGYKAGGYNTQMFSDVLQQKLMGYMGFSKEYDVDDIISYRPEWSWNYEIGAHLDFPAISLRSDIAAFYIDCHDQQLTIFPDGNTTGRMTANAGRTRSIGVELSMHWTHGKRWRIDASWGFTDARFRSYFDGIRDYRGCRVPYAPANTVWLSGGYTLPVGRMGHSVELNLAARGVGKIYWDDANTISQPFYVVPSASIFYHAGKWDLEAWVNNFTDTRYDVFSFVSIGHSFVQKGRGIKGGLTFSVNFDNIL